MRLTAEIINLSLVRISPIKQRELSLRDLKIPEIENLGAAKDLNDAIDFTNNDIHHLGNFPQLKRLCILYLANNRISTIDPDLGQQLPNLTSLVLSKNEISQPFHLEPLKKLHKLNTLILLDNPIATTLPNYRLWCIYRFPQISNLDFSRVKDKERAEAKLLFETEDKEPTQAHLDILQSFEKVKAGLPAPKIQSTQDNGKLNHLSNLSTEEQSRLQKALAQANALV